MIDVIYMRKPEEAKETVFDFRIIELGDGVQVIENRLKTPMDSLTPEMQQEYMEVHNQLAVSERIKREKQRKREHMRKLTRNPFYRLAFFCGLV